MAGETNGLFVALLSVPILFIFTFTFFFFYLLLDVDSMLCSFCLKMLRQNVSTTTASGVIEFE
jgi:hypothetical protein